MSAKVWDCGEPPMTTLSVETKVVDEAALEDWVDEHVTRAIKTFFKECTYFQLVEGKLIFRLVDFHLDLEKSIDLAELQSWDYEAHDGDDAEGEFRDNAEPAPEAGK